jgi:2-oxoisovalerate dehydrogenase E1 component alpha subunit
VKSNVGTNRGAKFPLLLLLTPWKAYNSFGYFNHWLRIHRAGLKKAANALLLNRGIQIEQTKDVKEFDTAYRSMMSATPSTTFIRDLYARMLLTRIVDDYAWRMHEQGRIDFVASCRGHEAIQVGSAVCIEVGKDFTVPYYRDLGVVLTIGMTPYEVFCTYLQTHPAGNATEHSTHQHMETKPQAMLHWGYHKHNTVTNPTPSSTQILHAAGIAFACKLRKAPVVTVAYCSDGVTSEPDFLAGIQFAAQHQLPVVFVCEQDCPHPYTDTPSCLCDIALPDGLAYQHIDGRDVATVYNTMRIAMQHAREGNGPILLEMSTTRFTPDVLSSSTTGIAAIEASEQHDPLVRYRQFLQEQGLWDDEWAAQLYQRFTTEVERAMQDALRDTPC